MGDARGALTVFADPTTETTLIQQAVIARTGHALLDPSYLDPATQQQALYQGSVDYLKAHPEVHLGDHLSAGQVAAVAAPMLWYDTRRIDGQDVLVPILILPPGDAARYTPHPDCSIRGK